MIHNKMRKAITRNLTPKRAWDLYVGTSEEIFISNFYAEKIPVTDLNKMCRIYSREIPMLFEGYGFLFTDKQIKEIEALLINHLENYIHSKGGINKLDLFTVKELDLMMDEAFEEAVELMALKFNTTKEMILRALRS